MQHFGSFWERYPRREAKREAEKAWRKLSDAEQQAAMAALPNHLRKWADTEKRFIPYASTWLNGARWEDEVEVEVPKAAQAWWTTEEGTMAKGRELGMDARPGEDMAGYRKRIADRIRSAA